MSIKAYYIMFIVASSLTSATAAFFLGANMGYDTGVKSTKLDDLCKENGYCEYHNGKRVN